MILIVGASGFVGNNLYHSFKKNNVAVIGTCCNKHEDGLVYFDMLHQSLIDIHPDLSEVTHVIFCAAISNISTCFNDPEFSRQINVVKTWALINECFSHNIVPIFLSSDYVFDGETGLYKDNDIRIPTTMYGKQKKEVEDLLIDSTQAYLILRISKIYDFSAHPQSFIGSLRIELNDNQTLKMADDQVFSPTYVGDLVQLIHSAINANLSGLYNAGGCQAYSRFEVANLVKRSFDISTGKVIKCSIRDFPFTEPRPLNTSLNSTKISHILNFKLRSLEQVLETDAAC